MLDTISMLRATTPFLGTWNFPMKRLIGFQAYTSETAPKRRRQFFSMLALGILACCILLVLFDWYVLFLVMPLIFIGYPLLQNNKPAPFDSGIVLYFAKTDRLQSLVHAPASMHICATDTIIQDLISIAEPILEQNTKSIAD